MMTCGIQELVTQISAGLRFAVGAIEHRRRHLGIRGSTRLFRQRQLPVRKSGTSRALRRRPPMLLDPVLMSVTRPADASTWRRSNFLVVAGGERTHKIVASVTTLR